MLNKFEISEKKKEDSLILNVGIGGYRVVRSYIRARVNSAAFDRAAPTRPQLSSTRVHTTSNRTQQQRQHHTTLNTDTIHKPTHALRV